MTTIWKIEEAVGGGNYIVWPVSYETEKAARETVERAVSRGLAPSNALRAEPYHVTTRGLVPARKTVTP